ncbi:IS110 family transposase [Nesterenkonia jeotgali]|uniref:Transposase n=1 Tax=Nesterenkonia jeotgali TaxID=317018 RepID=A0A839FW57_9MICC|nr:IS110 family transposase [Nesterenkonia jeotgali]MBA8921314.1 transposase [Nesterenkonia jeotgali]
MAFDLRSFALFIGLDVGKSEHHATALTRDGEKVYDKPLPNDETRLRELFAGLTGEHGAALVIVDQPATIGALPVAVAQAVPGIEIAYLPGLTMRRMADLHAGSAKTDARDAFIIAETARTMPAALRSIAVSDEQVAELAVLAGFDDDLLGQMTAARNRLRGLLTQIHPALERAMGPHLHQVGVLDALVTWPTPQRLKSAGRGHVRNRIKKHNPRLAERVTEEIFSALEAQTVVVAGTGAAATIVPILASQLQDLTRQRAGVLAQVEALVEAHPLYRVLTSMPGIGVRTAARILTKVVGKDFKTAGHLASYAGIAPTTRRSGTSIRGEFANRGGNKRLKSSLYNSAFAALHHPPSRAYYDRKVAEGKRHKQAIIALARRRLDTLYAMLRDGTLYQDPAAPIASEHSLAA